LPRNSAAVPKGTPPTSAIPPRVRQAFQVDALFELICGLILLMNPLLGPKFPVSGFVVSLVGVFLLVVTVLLGGAGLGKGPFASRLPLLIALNIISGIACVLWSLFDMQTGASTFLRVLGVCLIALGVWQLRAMSNLATVPPKRRASPAELRAAIEQRKTPGPNEPDGRS
jgi:uncharacterized membrane protein HdeD (DUF308 family)